jgi:hypothetical protein
MAASAFGLIGRPFTSEVALAGYSLVRLGDALDSVLKLAASLGQLLDYHVAGTGRPPNREGCGQRDPLTGLKLMFCHSTSFPAHAGARAHQRASCPPATESIIRQSDPEAYEATDAEMFLCSLVCAKIRMPNPPCAYTEPGAWRRPCDVLKL